MSRNLSSTALEALHAQHTDEVIVALLTIEHPGLDEPIRVCSDTRPIERVVESVPQVFIPMPFQFTLPEETDGAPPRVTLAIDNIDRQIVDAIRAAQEPPRVTIEIVFASSPDVTEMGPFDFTLREASYDAMTVTAQLAYEDILNEQFPAHSFDPANFPGLFK